MFYLFIFITLAIQLAFLATALKGFWGPRAKDIAYELLGPYLVTYLFALLITSFIYLSYLVIK